ncbi:hypothetical protein KE423_003903 [Salmonella enterica]|nr:hypothetical protein [Salmonella enterica]
MIIDRLRHGPATVGELLRAGATEDEIADLVKAGVAVILQYNEDPDARIIGAYRNTFS